MFNQSAAAFLSRSSVPVRLSHASRFLPTSLYHSLVLCFTFLHVADIQDTQAFDVFYHLTAATITPIPLQMDGYFGLLQEGLMHSLCTINLIQLPRNLTFTGTIFLPHEEFYYGYFSLLLLQEQFATKHFNNQGSDWVGAIYCIFLIGYHKNGGRERVYVTVSTCWIFE